MEWGTHNDKTQRQGCNNRNINKDGPQKMNHLGIISSNTTGGLKLDLLDRNLALNSDAAPFFGASRKDTYIILTPLNPTFIQ